MVDNFQLKWRITVEFPDGRSEPLTIGYPLTIEFDINRSGKSDDQNAVFRIYNLNRSTSRLLFKDILSDNDKDKMPIIYFEAGYNDTFSLVYRGNILECNTYRDGGSTEVITELSCFDLNVLKYVGKTYSANTPVKDIIRDVASVLKLEVGTIGDFQKIIKGNYTASGNGIDIIEELTGGCAFVDLGILHVLAPNECLNIDNSKFTSANIFGTPRRSNGFITFNTLLNTSITLFQLVDIESTIQPESNGTVKVFDIKHKGTISASVPCSAQTTLTCWYGATKRDLPINITVNTEEQKEEGQKNVSEEKYRKEFVKIKNEKPVLADSKSNISILDVFRDIKANGAKAKSLSQKVLGRVQWHEIIDYPNVSGAERPTYEQVSTVYNTLTVLTKFIKSNIGNVAITPTSGWRSISNNRAIGGVADSRHLKGQAIDFKFSSPELTKKYSNIFYNKWTYGWTHFYPEKNFIHVQIGGNKPDRR